MISVVTTTLSKGKIFKKFRVFLKNEFKEGTLGYHLGELLHCPYCLAHWVSFIITPWYMYKNYEYYEYFHSFLFDFIIISFALVAISSLPTFLLIKYLKWLDTIN